MVDPGLLNSGTKKCNVLGSHADAPEFLTKRLPLPGKRRRRTRSGKIRKRKEECGSCIAGNGGVTDIPDVSHAGHNGISSE